MIEYKVHSLNKMLTHMNDWRLLSKGQLTKEINSTMGIGYGSMDFNSNTVLISF